MLLLTSTSDNIWITTTTTADIEVHISYADNASGTITLGRQNTMITTIGDTGILASPTSGVVRNVKSLIIRNTHASTSNQITIGHFDGTLAPELFETVLSAGETIQYIDERGFQVFASNGAVKTSQNQGSNTLSSSLSSVVLSGDIVNNNVTANSIADVTGLSFPVTAGNKYWFRFIIPYTSAATTTGSRWTINGPSFSRLNYRSTYCLTATTETVNYATAYDIPAASNASSLVAGNVAMIEGIIVPSADGTVIARFASEIANSAITAKAGAVVYYQQVD